MPRRRSRMPESFAVQGRLVPVTGTVRIAGREYGLLESLSSLRERLLVVDPDASPRGELRLIHFYPRTDEADERMRVLKRLSERDSRFPTIVSYHHQRDRIAVVLMWSPGVSLADYLRRIRRGHLPATSVSAAVRMYRNVAHAVGQLHHSINVIHADVKPANLILPPDSTNLRLIDFGSAWCAERAVATAGGRDGLTWDVYAAPEQRRSECVPDFRADIFASSVIFYELLTRQAPYNGMGGGAGASDELRAEYGITYTPPSRLGSHLTAPRKIWGRIDAIAARALALDPNDRYSGRGEWLEAVDDLFAALIQKPRLGGGARLMSGIVGQVAKLLHRGAGLPRE